MVDLTFICCYYFYIVIKEKVIDMKLIKKAFVGLGSSSTWVLMFLFTVVFEFIFDQPLKSMFFMMMTFLGYFLSRIAEAIEAKNKTNYVDVVYGLQFKDGKPVTHKDT
jgi:hypothetical protein